MSHVHRVSSCPVSATRSPQWSSLLLTGAMLPEALGRSSLLELREEGFGGKFANLVLALFFPPSSFT